MHKEIQLTTTYNKMYDIMGILIQHNIGKENVIWLLSPVNPVSKNIM